MAWPQVQISTGVTALPTASTVYDPPNIIDGSQATVNVSVPGAVLGDYAMASFGISQAGVTVSAYVSATDIATVVFYNGTGSDLNLASSTLRVSVIKQ